MDPTFKKIIFFLPPLIIAGVFFNIIPLDKNIRDHFESFFSSDTKVEIKRINATVEKIFGEATFQEKPNLPVTKLIVGQILTEGASIVTGEKSSVLLTLKGTYQWKVRLSSKTQVNIDELMKMKTEETTFFNLVRGGLILVLENKSGIPRRVNVRTKFASFAVRGTTIAVLTDEEKQSLMTVHDGTVEAENFKEMSKSIVKTGHTYLINRDGKSKIELDYEALGLYNWDTEDLDVEFPEIFDVIEKVGDIGLAPDEKEKEKLKLLKEIDENMTMFKNQNDSFHRDLDLLRENAEETNKGYLDEKAKIERDIRCIETSVSECRLYSAKILQENGFPRLWGNPRYKASMVEGLKDYIGKRNEVVRERTEKANDLSRLVKTRDEVFGAVMEDRKQEKNLEKLLPLLQDQRLR